MSEWTERVKGKRTKQEKQPVSGGCEVTISSSNLYLLDGLMHSLGNPEAVRFMVNGNKIGIVAADPDHKNSYTISGNNQTNVSWLKTELSRGTQPQGRFKATYENGMWVVDLE